MLVMLSLAAVLAACLLAHQTSGLSGTQPDQTVSYTAQHSAAVDLAQLW